MSLRSYSAFNGSDRLSEIAAEQVGLFNARLTEELIRSGIPSHARLRYLSKASGRAVQTVARWIDLREPGMPDLRSFTVLCLLLSVDAHWLLGLTEHRVGLPLSLLSKRLTSELALDSHDSKDWLNTLVARVDSRPASCRVEIMHGHDMEPLISDGAIIFVDDSVHAFTVNGTYVLEYRDKMLIRNVELIIGDGIILRCENKNFSDTRIQHGDLANDNLLKVIGKVTMAINVIAVP